MRHSDQLIRRYLDGELTPAAAEDLRDHLASCPRCRNQLAAIQQLDARLRSLDQLTPPPDFAARVRAQVAALPPQRPASWLGPLSLVSAILGLAGILWAAEQFFALASSILTVASDLQSRLLDLI